MSNANQNNRYFSTLEPSNKVQYALLALLELVCHHGKDPPLTISEITARQPIPERYLEQIFTLLRRGGLVQSLRGAKGGYKLVREPWQITVLEVIRLVEGDRKLIDVASGSTIERDLIHEIWQQADHAFQRVLSDYTLQDLCQQRDDRNQNHFIYYI